MDYESDADEWLQKSNQQDLLRYLQSKYNTPELTETLQLLKKGNNLPNIHMKEMGPFDYGRYQPWGNSITLNNDMVAKNYPAAKSAVLHEYTHALDSAMRNDVYHNPNTQFAEGYDKLNPEKSNLPKNRNEKFYDKGPQDEGWQYRTNNHELRGFGVGNQYHEEDSTDKYLREKGVLSFNMSNPHTDPTMATDMAVLRELYNRKLNAQQSSNDWLPSWIQKLMK